MTESICGINHYLSLRVDLRFTGKFWKMLGENMTTFIHGERLGCRFEVKKNDSFQGPWEKVFGHLNSYELPVSNVNLLFCVLDF